MGELIPEGIKYGEQMSRYELEMLRRELGKTSGKVEDCNASAQCITEYYLANARRQVAIETQKQAQGAEVYDER